LILESNISLSWTFLCEWSARKAWHRC